MLRKLSFGLFCMAGIISNNSHALELNNNLQAKSVVMEFELPPNQPQPFTNYMFWAIEAHCAMISEDDSNDLYIVAVARKGKVNDVPLVSGQSVQITIHPNDNIKLNADSGAKVEITNLGTHTVKAVCTA